MRLRVPWSELAALLAGYIALVAWSASHTPVDAEAAVTAGLALAAALIPRRALASKSPAAAEGAAVAGALAAVAIATTVAGARPPGHTLGLIHAVATAEVLAVGTVMALALPLRARTLRRAAVPALLIGALTAVAFWPGTPFLGHLPPLRRLAPFAGGAMALAYAHAVRRPLSAVERARLVVPGLGAAALTVSMAVWAWWGPTVSPVVLASGLTALVVGLTLGTGAIALEHASAFGRRMVGAAAGFAAGAIAAALLPAMPAAAVAVGALTMLLVQPVLEKYLRPDAGALLDACEAIERALPAAQTLHDLAAAALDPLRLAAKDLQAPAALWVLDRQEALRIDVAGAASSGRLSLESERAVLSWLRARPVPLFPDLLRPHLVRRAEFRPVVAALDAHGALAALPLLDDGELAGVLLVPRGARTEVPTYEEEVRLVRTARTVAGALAMVSALSRAHERTRAALGAQNAVEEDRARAVTERDRLQEREGGARVLRAIGSLEEEWVGYSPAMRALSEAVTRCAPGDGPVALVADTGAGALAVARALHARSERAAGPFVTVDAAALHPRDTLAALLGDARTTPVRPGWMEHAAGGTLVLEELPALGYDAHVALLDALRTGMTRRVGGMGAYPMAARLVLVSRRAPEALDLPAELIARLSPATLYVPPLRARADDLESLVLAGLDRACRIAGRPTLGIAPEALAALRGYNWPGNVRELHDALEYAVGRARGTRVALGDLAPHVRMLFRAGSSDAGYDSGDDAYDDT